MNPAKTPSPHLEPRGDADAEVTRAPREASDTVMPESFESGVSGEQPADPNNTQEIFTIGHAALPWGQFLELLHRFGISLLVDIRRFPGSRHAPQFGQDAMRAALTADGIDYLHLLELGGRRRAQPDSPYSTWRNASFRGYADYMETEEFQNGLDRLMTLAQTKRVAIMCAESVWWRCHRSMVSDALLAHGWRVMHIMSDRNLQPHQYTAPARLVGGELTYHDEGPMSKEATE